jgi:hypothetical protein
MITQDEIHFKSGLGLPKGERLPRHIVHIALEFVEEIGFCRLSLLRGASTVLPFLGVAHDLSKKIFRRCQWFALFGFTPGQQQVHGGNLIVGSLCKGD